MSEQTVSALPDFARHLSPAEALRDAGGPACVIMRDNGQGELADYLKAAIEQACAALRPSEPVAWMVEVTMKDGHPAYHVEYSESDAQDSLRSALVRGARAARIRPLVYADIPAGKEGTRIDLAGVARRIHDAFNRPHFSGMSYDAQRAAIHAILIELLHVVHPAGEEGK